MGQVGADPGTGDEGPGDVEAEVERRERIVDAAWHGARADKFAVDLAPEFSRSHLQGLIERGHLFVDGVPLGTPARKLRVGQRVQLELVPTAESLAFRPEPMALDVVYEDEHLLVIDKPAGLVVHPAAGNWSGTLLNGLLARDPNAARLPRAGIVHRLDKDTSGLMLVGRSLPAVTALIRMIAAREVHRRYHALMHGAMAEADWQVEAPIARDPRSRLKMAVVASGKPARTDVRRIAVRERITAVQCTLHSGRTHQIRVHLSSRGHPLVADTLYGGAPALGLARQALHAARLALAHPVSGAPLVFERAPPRDFEAAWEAVVARAPRG